MEAILTHPASDNSMETRWGKMFIVSLALHLVVFSMILFVPERSATKKIRGIVYEVNLVDMPKGKRTTVQSRPKAKPEKRLSSPAKTSSSKRLSRPKSKAKPVVISKRTVKTKAKKLNLPVDPTKKHIDQALEKIKKKVEEGKVNTKEQAVTKLEAPAIESGGGQVSGRTDGITIHLYKIDVYETIKRNWSYPVQDDKSLAAIVELTVQNNGTILKTRMTQNSGNERFDQSVLKAIKLSDPLPPFPEGYRKTHEEIEINFNLSELEH